MIFSIRFTSSLVALLPIYISMMVIGFLYKDECPADVRIPHYLFFGGIAGLIGASMRLLMMFTWTHYKEG